MDHSRKSNRNEEAAKSSNRKRDIVIGEAQVNPYVFAEDVCSTPRRVTRALRQLSTYNPYTQIDSNQQLGGTRHQMHKLREEICRLGTHLPKGPVTMCKAADFRACSVPFVMRPAVAEKTGSQNSPMNDDTPPSAASAR